MKIHLVGIGGVGMGNLASLLKLAGHQVAGSDAKVYPPMSDFLLARGIPYHNGYDAKNIAADIEIAVIGNVARADNPEVLALQTRGVQLLSMPQAIHRMLLPGRESIVISGTHGKTTTTAMTTHCLRTAGFDPGFLVGGIANDLGTGSGLGSAKGGRNFFVLEGDEYDSAFFQKEPKFLSYAPKYLIITSLEFDHADIYPDLASIVRQFERLVALVPKEGLIIACSDYPEAIQVTRQARCRVMRYGSRGDDDIQLQSLSSESGNGFSWTHRQTQQQCHYSLKLMGDYNSRNAAAVATLLHELSVDEAAIRTGIATFSGVRRRQQVLFESERLLIMEDFAHHPTAISVTLTGLKQRYPLHEIWACFEPRSNTTRRNFFQKQLPEAFQLADRTLLYKVFNSAGIPEGERLNRQTIQQELALRGKPCELVDDIATLATKIQKVDAGAKPRLILLMTNGDFDGLKPLLAQQLGFSLPSGNSAE